MHSLAERQAPYIIASGLIHIVYDCCLVWLYRVGHFSGADSVARGSSPLLVTVSALFYARDAIVALRLLGVVMVSGGIVLLVFQEVGCREPAPSPR